MASTIPSKTIFINVPSTESGACRFFGFFAGDCDDAVPKVPVADTPDMRYIFLTSVRCMMLRILKGHPEHCESLV
ncbi:hypothetical protein GCM10027027_03650 [Neomicrococcus lactis]